MMKRTCKILLTSLILICCIPFVSAYMINNVNIDPAGALTPGQRVSVTYGVSFPLTNGKTFESADTLDMYTDLANAKWSIVKIETYEGVPPIETPLGNYGGPRAQVGGWILSYPDRELAIRVTLDGVAPDVDTTQNKTIIKISELDSFGTANIYNRLFKRGNGCKYRRSSIMQLQLPIQIYRSSGLISMKRSK